MTASRRAPDGTRRRREGATRAASPDVLVVGGGPAGLAAAASAADADASVTLVERDTRLGGILNQCVHDGFGLELFGESLTGPEFAGRLAASGTLAGVDVLLSSMVLSMGRDPSCEALSCEVLTPDGYRTITPKAIVLSMGCRERSLGSLAIAGSRPAGIYSAGTAQRLVNIEGFMIGRRAVFLGSGDVGLIMARRLTLEGAAVACVVERLPYAGGLARNVSQCLNDFGIPLLLDTTVVEVLGRDRVAGVVVADVGSDGLPVDGTERTVECDTLLVSVGLIPENELTRQAGADMDRATGGAVVDDRLMTSIPGLFACGNALHVHDLADWASLEGRRAGALAASFAASPWAAGRNASVISGEGIRYVVPQRIAGDGPVTLSFRVSAPRTPARIVVAADDETLVERRFPYVTPSELAGLELPFVPGGTRRLEVHLG